MGKLYKAPLFQAVTVTPLKSLSAAFDSVISSSTFHLCVFTYMYYDVLLLIRSPGVFTHTSNFWTALLI